MLIKRRVSGFGHMLLPEVAMHDVMGLAGAPTTSQTALWPYVSLTSAFHLEPS